MLDEDKRRVPKKLYNLSKNIIKLVSNSQTQNIEKNASFHRHRSKSTKSPTNHSLKVFGNGTVKNCWCNIGWSPFDDQ